MTKNDIVVTLWFFSGFLLCWASALIKQSLYWKEKGRVAILFGGLEDWKDWVDCLFLSVLLSYGGFLNLIYVWEAIKDVIEEEERLKGIGHLFLDQRRTPTSFLLCFVKLVRDIIPVVEQSSLRDRLIKYI